MFSSRTVTGGTAAASGAVPGSKAAARSSNDGTARLNLILGEAQLLEDKSCVVFMPSKLDSSTGSVKLAMAGMGSPFTRSANPYGLPGSIPKDKVSKGIASVMGAVGLTGSARCADRTPQRGVPTPMTDALPVKTNSPGV